MRIGPLDVVLAAKPPCKRNENAIFILRGIWLVTNFVHVKSMFTFEKAGGKSINLLASITNKSESMFGDGFRVFTD